MGGVIVVDAGRSRSTCLGCDAYIHDHCLEYRHNYVLFYQLPKSNLFTHVCYVLEREASSENYGPESTFIIYKIKKPCYNFIIVILFCNLSICLPLRDLILANNRRGD